MSLPCLTDPNSLLNIYGVSPIDDGFLIAYFSDQVLVGRWKNNHPVLPRKMIDWENLLQLHIFNEKEEIRFIKSQSRGWLMRYLNDEGDERDWYDEHLLIIGNPPKQGQEPGNEGLEKGFFSCSEAGRRVDLPEEARGKCLKVRNYLEDVPFKDGEGDTAPAQGANVASYQFPELYSLRVRDYRFVDFSNCDDARSREGGDPT